MTSTWSKENPSGSRTRIVEHLLKGQNTVDELASSLDVTANAVRAQIALLMREGIVEVKGEVKRTRRPAAVYGIRAGADVHYSKAYPMVLSQLLKTLPDLMTQKQINMLMRDVGLGLADAIPKPAGNARERVEGAVKFLASLGARADVTEKNGKVLITGNGCIISRAVEANVNSCVIMESLLSRHTGLPVTEHCDHNARPSCRFEIKLMSGK
jgi:predicted ArsR family transcriptional regulator